MKAEKRTRIWPYVATPILLVLVALFALLFFRAAVLSRQRAKVYERLQDAAREQAALLVIQAEGQVDVLRAFAGALALERAVPEKAELTARLNAVVAATRFNSLTVLDTAGAGYNNLGEPLTGASGAAYFRRAAAGKTGVLQVKDPAGRDNRFLFVVPILYDGAFRGVLLGNMYEERFRALLSAGDPEDGGYTFVCGPDGSVLIGSDHNSYLAGAGNVLTTLSEGELADGCSIAQVAADLEAGQSGGVSYTLVGRQRYAAYEPLGLEGWMLFRVLPASVMEADAAELVRGGIYMVLVLAAAALLAVLVLYRAGRRSTERLETDREQMRLSDARFRIALENGHLSIWDYDFNTHSIIQPENTLMLHGRDRVIVNVPQSLVAGGIVHPDSVHEFLEMFKRLNAGEEQAEGVFRIRRGEQGYWYQHIRYRTVKDKQGRPYRAIGIAEDVTERFEAARRYQSELQELSDLAQRDPLTGLLNRAAAEKSIGRQLAQMGPDDVCALYIADLDGFKLVNDLLGHQRGDQTLTEIARTIRGVFRATDVTGRLGGDEFLVFLTASDTPGLIESRAAELCSALQFLYPSPQGQISVTASIGVASCTGGNRGFRELYSAADAALYRAKNEGRARYVLTDLDAGETHMVKPAERTVDALPAIPMQALLQYMDGGVVLCEMAEEPHILYVSPSFYTASHRDAGSLGQRGERLLSAVYPEDLPVLMDSLRAGAEHGTVIDHVYRVNEIAGAVGWRHLRAVRIPYEGTDNPVLLGVVTDISELILGREELRAANLRLNFAFEQSGLLLWEWDPLADRLRFWQADGADPSPEEALVQSWMKRREAPLRAFLEGARTAPDSAETFELPGPEGTLRCALRCKPVSAQGKSFWLLGVARLLPEE